MSINTKVMQKSGAGYRSTPGSDTVFSYFGVLRQIVGGFLMFQPIFDFRPVLDSQKMGVSN